MENIFKYDLFIGKNTPELRKKLEGLGYWLLPNGYMEWHIPIDECPFLTTDRRGFYKGVMANWNDGHKDCGIDEDLFLELAKVKKRWKLNSISIAKSVPQSNKVKSSWH